MALTFNALLRAEGVDPAGVRLLRHETRRHGRTPYTLWRDDPARFDDYQRVQLKARRGWFDHPVWASFVATPTGDTLFVGAVEPRPAGDVPADWDDPLSGRDAEGLKHYELYALRPVEALAGYAGKLTVEWGPGARSWNQRAASKDKPVLELRERFVEPSFPGYPSLVVRLSDLDALPADWIGALAAARGVYLLTCPRTREQYVGSACGQDGFLGRWRGYASDGHGGNVALKSRAPEDYQVSILQLAGSEDAGAILAMEALWKRKLQSREMGLNRN